MSSKHHGSPSNGVMHDITILSHEELSEQYGIEIEDDKTVWDPVEGKSFKDLSEWAAYIVEQEDGAAYDHHYEKMGHKHAFDDGC